ncbi:ATP-binding protein [Streptomyces spongiicola]|uniref:ATP-binding protein n=1 Tax=Streptomyces spongiicola TaxID=1690221 RepID=A0A388T376_9ACTN|nr:ATP-binding protein [Streptomyces spongiicola]GBQ02632.1 ATP-binding protein [Streptomyces spongiicola]
MTTHVSTISTTTAGHGSRRATQRCGPKPLPEGPCATPQEPALEGLPPLGGFAACGLDGSLRNPCQARRFVAHTLHLWELPLLVADMTLVVSELVTGAVRHALLAEPQEHPVDYPLWLGLVRHPDHVVCSVADPNPEPPGRRDADSGDFEGFGLELIGALSESWSWSLTEPRGKTVWASLALPGRD